MNIGPVQILIIALVILVLFGRGRISEMMGDFGKGVSSFRKGMSEVEEPKPAKPVQIAHDGTATSETTENAPADKTSS